METDSQITQPSGVGSSDLLAIVRGMTFGDRAKLWCSLNRQQWPDELSEHKPEGWDEASKWERLKIPIAKMLWGEIRQTTPKSVCLAEWNRDTKERQKVRRAFEAGLNG